MFIVKKEGLAVIAGCIQPGQELGQVVAAGLGRPGKRAHLQCAAMRMRRSPLRVNYVQMAEYRTVSNQSSHLKLLVLIVQ